MKQNFEDIFKSIFFLNFFFLIQISLVYPVYWCIYALSGCNGFIVEYNLIKKF